MKVTVEKEKENVVKLDIVIPAKDAVDAYNGAVRRISEYVNIDGFRKGKAPRAVIERHVGVERIKQEAIESLMPRVIGKAISDNNLDVIAQPYITNYKFNVGEDLTVEAKAELRPEVTLGKYKGLKLEVKDASIDKDALQKQLEGLQQQHSTQETVIDRPTKDTDIAVIDFEGTCNGEKIKGGDAKNYPLDLGHSNFIPGFAEQLVDHEKGEEFKIQVKFPDEYHDEKLKGQDAEFNIKINAVKERILPEINDDLAKRVNQKFNTLDDMKKDIETYLENTTKAENNRRISNKIFDTLLEQTDIKIQDNMINREIQALMGEFKQRINMQGGNFDEMLEREGHEKIYAQLKEEAVKRIKTSLIVGKIAQNEKVTLTNEDIQNQIAGLANVYRTTSNDIVAELQKNPNLLNSMNQQIIIDKVTKLLIEKTKVNYKN